MIPLTLYTTVGCHLCDDAEAVLHELSLTHDIHINLSEIGDDNDLIDLYGTLIPVVEFPDNSTLNWPFDIKDIINKVSCY